MKISFQKARKQSVPARIAISGPSGSGKTYTSLEFATALLVGTGKRAALVDTEGNSASLYGDLFDFDSFALSTYDPRVANDAIAAAEDAGYGAIVFDSLSHFWMGEGGALDIVERSKSKYGGNRWAAWAEVTPMHNQLVTKILNTNMHVLVTMRSKTEWVIEESGGKKSPKAVGTDPIMRDGIEYEFSLFGEMDRERNGITFMKSRCPNLQGKTFFKPGADVIKIYQDWMADAVPRHIESLHKAQEALGEDRYAAVLATLGMEGFDLTEEQAKVALEALRAEARNGGKAA